jgi:hypothetical protein
MGHWEHPIDFGGGSVIYNGKKVKIALYLAVFVTRDREGYVLRKSSVAGQASKWRAQGASFGGTAERLECQVDVLPGV